MRLGRRRRTGCTAALAGELTFPRLRRSRPRQEERGKIGSVCSEAHMTTV